MEAATRIDRPSRLANAARYAIAGLLLYPVAMGLPLVETARMGRRVETNLLEGVSRLWASGHVALAVLVAFCSVVLPAAKLLAACVFAGSKAAPSPARLRVLEFLGRYGMLDVFVAALLVCVVKLGDWVSVRPLPGLFALVGVVVLSLLSTAELRAAFHPPGQEAP